MEGLILLLFPIPLFLIGFLLQRKNKRSSNIHYPPGPPKLPLIGNLHQLDTSCLHKYLTKLSKDYGPLMSLKLGSIPTLVISSARLAEEVMKNHDLIFCSRPKMLGMQRLSYNGSDIAVAPYNQEWREMRKICVIQLLSAKRIQMYRPIREDEVSRMIKRISEQYFSSHMTNLSETILSLTFTMIVGSLLERGLMKKAKKVLDGSTFPPNMGGLSSTFKLHQPTCLPLLSST